MRAAKDAQAESKSKANKDTKDASDESVDFSTDPMDTSAIGQDDEDDEDDGDSESGSDDAAGDGTATEINSSRFSEGTAVTRVADEDDVAFDRLLHAPGINTWLHSAPEYLVSTKWINTSELASNELPISAHYHVTEPVILVLTYAKDRPGRIENAAETAAYLRARLRER